MSEYNDNLSANPVPAHICTALEKNKNTLKCTKNLKFDNVQAKQVRYGLSRTAHK